MQFLGAQMALKQWGRIVIGSSIGVKFGGGDDSYCYSLSKMASELIPKAARSFFQYVKEIQRPEFGRGRLHMAMASAGAATERQRAVRATYGNKINPTNRLMGTEAMYHHSR